jgi:hypothetical protein
LLTVFWFFSAQESRYLVHVYVIATILAVFGWRYVTSVAARFTPWLSAAVIATSVLYGLFMLGPAQRYDIRAVFSKSFAQQRREQNIPFLESFEYVNKDAAVGNVLILDPSVPPYYSDKSYVKPFGQWGEHTLPDSPDLNGVLARLHDLHVTHVLDVNSGHFPFQLADHTAGLTLVFERPNQRIYSVNQP